MSARPKKIVMASSNAGKIREIARLLEDLDVEVVAHRDGGPLEPAVDGAAECFAPLRGGEDAPVPART